MILSGSAVHLKGLEGVVVFDEAVDGFVEVGDQPEDAALEPSLVRTVKKPSTSLSQEAEVGVKWKVQRQSPGRRRRAARPPKSMPASQTVKRDDDPINRECPARW
jgi:hypothetical protein